MVDERKPRFTHTKLKKVNEYAKPLRVMMADVPERDKNTWRKFCAAAEDKQTMLVNQAEDAKIDGNKCWERLIGCCRCRIRNWKQ